jgi:beta-glucosidase-like glycosyl hydrolase
MRAETPGEDPTLNGEYGAQFISGFQGLNASAKPDAPLKSSSCAKHYFAYSLENCYTFGDNCRLNFNAITTQQDIEDTYLPAFQSAVERGGVSGLMCS